MTTSLVASSVFAVPITANYSTTAKLPANQTAASATNIGNLEEQSAVVDVSDQGTGPAGVPQTSNFSLSSGDTIFLNSSFSNVVDQAVTHIQLFDGSGNLLADNQGTSAQQQAYLQLVSQGLTPGEGTYSVVVTPLSGAGAPSVSLNVVHQQGTSLNVQSQLTSADPNEYYNFSLGDGNNIKLAFDAGQATPTTRVQLLDSNGNVVADSQGNEVTHAAFIALTSATGLAETSGNYTVKVSYADGSSTDQSPAYNFQLYSGTNYGVVYNTTAIAQPGDNSATGSVTATSTAQLFTRQGYNQINATADSSINIGWLAENKSQLEVESQLTTADSVDWYNFTYQSGDNLKFGLQNTTSTENAANLRVQLFDPSGTYVIADNYGTAAQKAAYAQLTSSSGLAAKTGSYAVKVSYAPGASVSQTQTYDFQVLSGTSYSSSYRTIASAQTYGNALLSGSISPYTAAGAAASYLNGLSQGSPTDILSALSEFA